MNRRRRPLAFDALEGKMLLSSIHPSGLHATAHLRPAMAKLPPIVRAVQGAVHKMGGTHVTVTPLIMVPGGTSEYEVTFQIRGQTYSTEVAVPYIGPKYGPQPG